jgi:hypothetical protein
VSESVQEKAFTLKIKGRRGVEEMQISARDDVYAARVAAKLFTRLTMQGGGFSPRLISLTPTIIATEAILDDATLPDAPLEAAAETYDEYSEPAERHDARAAEKKDRRAAARANAGIR